MTKMESRIGSWVCFNKRASILRWALTHLLFRFVSYTEAPDGALNRVIAFIKILGPVLAIVAFVVGFENITEQTRSMLLKSVLIALAAFLVLHYLLNPAIRFVGRLYLKSHLEGLPFQRLCNEGLKEICLLLQHVDSGAADQACMIVFRVKFPWLVSVIHDYLSGRRERVQNLLADHINDFLSDKRSDSHERLSLRRHVLEGQVDLWLEEHIPSIACPPVAMLLFLCINEGMIGEISQ